MSRPVIQLHTIDQWLEVDPSVRKVILQNIKLKDRLWKYLEERSKKPPLLEPKWVPCRNCEQRGWVELHPRYPGIHPSQISHPCLLKIYNELEGMQGQEKVEPKKQLIFDIGHAVHHMFQGYGMNGAWGNHYVPESPVSGQFQELADELMIEGSADAENILVIDNIPDCPYTYEVGLVHEYKTINSKAFAKLARPKPEHQRQAGLYSAALNRPVVVYLYFSKDDSNLADFPVEFDANMWGSIEGRVRVLVDHYHRNVRPKGETGFHCQECPYSLTCEDYRQHVLKRRE